MPSKEKFSFADERAPKIKQPHSNAQQLLDWLQRWGKSTVTAKEIYQYGPHPIRDRESAISSVEVLVKHGWLVPTQTRQRNYRIWQIVRKGPIVHPTVAG